MEHTVDQMPLDRGLACHPLEIAAVISDTTLLSHLWSHVGATALAWMFLPLISSAIWTPQGKIYGDLEGRKEETIWWKRLASTGILLEISNHPFQHFE
jgi:hypothetical protein